MSHFTSETNTVLEISYTYIYFKKCILWVKQGWDEEPHPPQAAPSLTRSPFPYLLALSLSPWGSLGGSLKNPRSWWLHPLAEPSGPHLFLVTWRALEGLGSSAWSCSPCNQCGGRCTNILDLWGHVPLWSLPLFKKKKKLRYQKGFSFLLWFLCFSVIAGLQCAADFLLYSKVTQAHLHICILFSHVVMLVRAFLVIRNSS